MVLFLATHFRNSSTDPFPGYVTCSDIPAMKGESHDNVKTIINRLAYSHLVEWETNESFRIQEALLNLAHELEHPKSPNYMADLTAWWFSKQWLVAVTAIAIAAPVIAQWVQWAFALWSAMRQEVPAP